ncbi:MAG: hypothetical protein DRN81_05610 [Thermoproteota archaeon]|nr:MAG: hypothetical protein DRN81_05610 [Candidatus Korarchaeota archaeon]
MLKWLARAIAQSEDRFSRSVGKFLSLILKQGGRLSLAGKTGLDIISFIIGLAIGLLWKPDDKEAIEVGLKLSAVIGFLLLISKWLNLFQNTTVGFVAGVFAALAWAVRWKLLVGGLEKLSRLMGEPVIIEGEYEKYPFLP